MQFSYKISLFGQPNVIILLTLQVLGNMSALVTKVMFLTGIQKSSDSGTSQNMKLLCSEFSIGSSLNTEIRINFDDPRR